MTKKNEQGLASIVVVGVLIVLLTVISLGFARIMQRTAQNSLNDQTAAAATYAAQSGINDLATYIRSNPTVKAENCKDLIGTASSRGPFYTSSNLSGDRNSEYTCVLLNQRPDSLYYQQIPALESKVIKMTTDSTTGSVDKMLVSWQATDRSKTVPAPLSNTLPDVTTWNAANYVPMLRLTLYPVTTAGSIAPIQGASRTIFLSPNSGISGAPDTVDYSAITEGGIQPVACRNNADDNDVTGFTDLANMDCNLAITGLADIPNIDYYYLRIMPIYSSIDFELRAKDIDDRTVKFRGVQAVLDVTAKVGPASKRLQARVDIGSNPANGTDPLVPSPNVGPDDTIPEHALRTANAICKRTLFHDTPYRYITFDGNPASCRSGSIVDTPNAAITYFRINSTDDTALTPSPYTGVSYIGASGTANLTWRTEHATACTGSRGIGAWAGPKNPPVMNWAGHVGTGSQSIPNITNVTYFDLRCNGPASTTSTRTVTAWPPPTVSFAGSDTAYNAGQTYRIRFSSTNASSCSMTSTGNKPWNQNYAGIQVSGGSSPGETRPFGTTWDDQSTKTYTVTCVDPSGRSTGPVTWTVGIGGSGSNTTINPPPCSGSRDIVDYGNGRGGFFWNMSCPEAAPESGNYRIESNIPGVGTGSIAPLMRNHMGTISSPGNYCLRAIATIPGWSTGGYDSGNKCVNILSAVKITYFLGNQIWDQGPQKCSNTVLPAEFRDTWTCRNNPNVVNISRGCPDQVHQFTMCNFDLRWTASGGNGSIICSARTSWYGQFSFGPGDNTLGGLGSADSYGWPWPNPVNTITLRCSDSDGRTDQTSGNVYP